MGKIASGIGNVLGGAVKNIIPAVVKTVAGPATDILKGITGSLFEKGAGALGKLADRLPGPLAGLAKGALGSLLPKLQDLANGGIEKLIGKLAGSVTERFAPGVGNVAVDSLQNRATTIAQQTAAASAGTLTTNPQGSSGSAGGADKAPDPSNYDMESIKGQQQFNKDMTNFQMRLSNMQNYWKAISDILKGASDVQNKMGANLR